MSLMVLICFVTILCVCAADIPSFIKEKHNLGEEVITHADGIEFDSISRGTLLNILAAFEESLLARLSGQNNSLNGFIMPLPHVSTYPDPGFWTKTSLIQLGYGVWVNLTMVVTGLTLGFTAVALPQIKQEDTYITVTLSDQSWITSILTLSSPIGCIVTGYLIDKLGRRKMLIVCHVPVALGWFYTALATNAKGLIIGRTITGIGLGMVVVVPRPYLSEIALPNMRGVIGTFPNLAMSIGLVVQAGLGSYFTWQAICYISMLFSLLLMFLNYFLPETPYFLLMNNTLGSAEASLRKFRADDYDIEAELEELMDFKTDNNIHKLTWKENILALFRRSSCKPFCLMTAYCVFAQFSGIYVITMWAVEIIERSKSSIDPHTGNILLGITRLISAVFIAIIIFKVGRRPLALISGFGVGVSSVTVGIYINYTHSLTVFPQICYITYIVFATLGHYTLPVLIMSELYPLQVRGILGGLSTSIINLLVFLVNALYPYMTHDLGFPSTIITFGVISLIGCIYLYFFLPETKDLTLQEIEEYYNDRRSTLTSQRRIVSMMQLSKAGLKRTDTASKSLIRITDRHKKSDKELKRSESSRNTKKKDDASTSQNVSE